MYKRFVGVCDSGDPNRNDQAASLYGALYKKYANHEMNGAPCRRASEHVVLLTRFFNIIYLLDFSNQIRRWSYLDEIFIFEFSHSLFW